MGAKGAGERFRNHIKNITTKVSTNVINMLQKEGPRKCYFCVFLGPLPRVLSRVSLDRLPGLFCHK